MIQDTKGVIAQYDSAIQELQNTQAVSKEVSDIQNDFNSLSTDESGGTVSDADPNSSVSEGATVIILI